MSASKPTSGPPAPAVFDVRVLRQDGPGQPPYWETHRVAYEANMNVISALQRIAAKGETVDGKRVAPIAWECNCLEEVCGACTMLINGRVRQSCSALIDRLLEERPTIELQPMSKFPVVRDLVVDRARLFRALIRIRAWLPVDGYYALGHGPLQSREDQERIYPLSQCMSCGCCLEACPQFLKIEPVQRDGETNEEFAARKDAEFDRRFMGVHAISQVVLHNTHPTGRRTASERLDALISEGGIQVCGNAQNCVTVCPKEIPLTTSIGQAGRAATVYSIKRWFDR
jgi:succinate dehydrogenase / fumarate reductase, iron-sulfur subunit